MAHIDCLSILNSIYNKLYKRDVDYSLNIFLCGADTSKKGSIRKMLNTELQKDAKFNVVFPETIFSSLLVSRGNNLLTLEDDLASFVDVIILPLEGFGTICELGAFAVNTELLPKLIAINEQKNINKRSFINLGPLDLIEKNNKKNLIYFDSGRELEMISKVIDRLKNKRYDKELKYELSNLFNLSRFLLYLIALFQPITKDGIRNLLKIYNNQDIKFKYIDVCIQILIQRGRIQLDFDSESHKEIYLLSINGHNYVNEVLIRKLQVIREFTLIRTEIINSKYHNPNYKLEKELELLVLA